MKAPIKPVIVETRGEHSINTGQCTEYKIDLALGKGYQGGPISAHMLGYTTASVTVTGIRATGTSGTSDIKQSNDEVGNLFDLEVAKSVDFTENEVKGAFDVKVSGEFLILDLSAITFGTEGKLIIKIVQKR